MNSYSQNIHHVADKCHAGVGVQTFWASTIEDRAKVDLKFHFMKKTLNEVVSSCLIITVAGDPPHPCALHS